jgi:ABC-type transporter Mla subunit MlaD
MILTETISTNLFHNRLAQIYQETESLNAITKQLKTKQQQLTQLFHHVQQQGKELLNQSNRLAILQEIEQIHRLCPTQTKRSQVSLQLQQFSTPLPLGDIAKVAANPIILYN